MDITSYNYTELRTKFWRDPNFSGSQRSSEEQELKYLYKYSVLKVKINLYWGEGSKFSNKADSIFSYCGWWNSVMAVLKWHTHLPDCSAIQKKKKIIVWRHKELWKKQNEFSDKPSQTHAQKNLQNLQKNLQGKIELSFLILAQPRAIMFRIFLVLADNLLNPRSFLTQSMH